MAKSKTKTEEAPATTSGIEAFENVKALLADSADLALQIKVTDESSLGIANQRLSAINGQMKLIEEKRVELKEPHLKAGKAIDAAAKELSSIGEKAVNHLKTEVKNFNLEIIRKQEELRKQQEEAQKKAEEENLDKRRADYLAKIKDWLESQFSIADTIEKCDAILQAMALMQPVDSMGKFQTEYKSLLEMYGSLTRTKKGELEGKIAKGTVDNHIQVLGGQLNAQIEAVVAAEAQKEVVVAVDPKIEEELARLESQKATNQRWSWKFELTDIEKVPLAWLCLDEVKVKKYIKENKDSMKDGQLFNGIKFIKDFTVVTK